MAECSELSLIAELRRSVDNKKKRRVETSQSNTVLGESFQLMEQPTEQPRKLTRKRPLSSERTDTNTKKQRVQLPLVPDFDGDDFSASDDDDIQKQNNQSKSLDAILDSSEEDEALEEGEVNDEDMLADLQAAFQQTAETGPNIDQKIADVLNMV